MMAALTITVWGHVPGKKNSYGYSSRTGRRFVDPVMKRQINDIIIQIGSQAGNIAPFDNPAISYKLVCRDARGDRDNKITTLQDCLVKAGVLVNDNIAHLNGPEYRYPVKISPTEHAIIRIAGEQQ